MGRTVVKIKDLYFEWSTIVDAPVTFGLTLEEMRDSLKEDYGQRGLDHFDSATLARIEQVGAGWRDGTTLEETVSGNRAGPDESELTIDEIYQAYGLREPIKGGWVAS